MARRISTDVDPEDPGVGLNQAPGGPPVVGGASPQPARPRVRTVSARSSIRAPRRLRISTPRLVLVAVAGVLFLGVSIYAFNVAEDFLIRDPRFAVRGFAGGDSVGQDEHGVPRKPTLLISGAKHAS